MHAFYFIKNVVVYKVLLVQGKGDQFFYKIFTRSFPKKSLYKKISLEKPKPYQMSDMNFLKTPTFPRAL